MARGNVAYFIERKNGFESWVYAPRDPVSEPETSPYMLVAAIIKIYATFAVTCFVPRSDPISVQSVAVFIALTETTLIAYSAAISPSVAAPPVSAASL